LLTGVETGSQEPAGGLCNSHDEEEEPTGPLCNCRFATGAGRARYRTV
jgi:hypothetical protein